MDIFQMSLSASILIVAIVIIRAVALHKLPKSTFLVLWGIAVLRLLVPFSIPSRFSVYTGLDMLKTLFAEKTAASFPTRIVTFPANMMHMPGVGESVGVGVPASSISAIEIVWLVGMCVCAIFFIVAYIKCRREFRMSLPVESDVATHWLQEHPLRRSVQIRQTDRIKAPLTYGVFRPVILLPKKTDWTDEKRLRYILTHEYVHIRRFDTLTKLVLTAVVCVHWFNPFVWVMYVLANRDIELSCDETVVRTFGESMKSAYALTLIGIEEKKGRFTPLVNHFSKNVIEERIVSIMKLKKRHVLTLVLAVILVSGVAVVFATAAARTDKAEYDNPKNMTDAIVDDSAIKYANLYIDKILAHFELTGSETDDISGTIATAITNAENTGLYNYAKTHILDENIDDDIRILLKYESFEFVPALSVILKESSHDARGQVIAAVYQEYANSIEESHPAEFESMITNLERWINK